MGRFPRSSFRWLGEMRVIHDLKISNFDALDKDGAMGRGISYPWNEAKREWKGRSGAEGRTKCSAPLRRTLAAFGLLVRRTRVASRDWLNHA